MCRPRNPSVGVFYLDLSANLLIRDMVLVRNAQKPPVASHFENLRSFTLLCSQGQWFSGIQKYGNDKGAHQLYL